MHRYFMIILLLCSPCTILANIKDFTIKPSSTSNLMPKDMSLDMVYITKHTKKAIINGKAYLEGQYIGPYKLHHIDFNSVILSSKNKIHHLKISNEPMDFKIHGNSSMDISAFNKLISNEATL